MALVGRYEGHGVADSDLGQGWFEDHGGAIDAFVQHLNLEIRGHRWHGGEHEQRCGCGDRLEGAHSYLHCEATNLGASPPICPLLEQCSLTPIKHLAFVARRSIL
jgi:hypothetical protein